jgi:hypothetical protein
MNPKYYVTSEEAQKVTDFLNKHNVGGGVKGVNLNEFVGPVSVPVVAGKQMVNLVLANGAQMNAGLTLDLMGKYSEWFVASMLAAMATPPREEE